jgi:hypothetical protein
MCFAERHINYVVSRAGRRVRLEGPFGQEKALTPLANDSRDHQLNPFTCRSYDRSELPKPVVGGGIEPLRPEHGWLEYTGSVTWFRSSKNDFALLAYDGRPLGTVTPQKYSLAAQKYVYWNPFDSKNYLITGNGSTEFEPLPEGPVKRGRIEPASAGARFLRSTQLNPRKKWDAGEAGLYFYRGSTLPKRLLTGLVEGMQVSENGCSAVLIVDPWDKERRELKLMAVNTCLGETRVDK